MNKLVPNSDFTDIAINSTHEWREYHWVFGSSPTPVIIIDSVDKILYFNDIAFTKLFNKAVKVIGSKWFELLKANRWNEHFPKNGQTFQSLSHCIIEAWIDSDDDTNNKWLITIQSMGVLNHKVLYFNEISDNYSFSGAETKNYSILSDTKGIIQWAGNNMFELFKSRSLKGRNLFSILLLNEVEVSDMLELNQVCIKKFRIRSRDVYIEIALKQSNSFKNLLEWTILDITDRMKNEEYEDYTNKLIEQALEKSNEAIVIHDTLKILYHNEKLESFLGPIRSKKMSIYDFVAPEYIEVVRNRLNKAASGIDLPFIPMRIKNFETGEFLWIESKPVFLFRNKKLNKPVFKILVRESNKENPLIHLQKELLSVEKTLESERSEKILMQKKVDELTNETSILKKELHHRVKNNSQIISSLIKRLLNQENRSAEHLLSLSSRINIMSVIHDLFYKERVFNNINIFDTIEEVFVHYKMQRNGECDVDSSVKNIMIGDSYLYSIDFSLSLGLIYHELLLFCCSKGSVNPIKFNIFVRSFVAKMKVLSLELFIESGESTNLILEEFLASEHFELIKIISDQIDGKILKTNEHQIFGIEINF